MDASFAKVIPAFLITCAAASVVFVCGVVLFLWVGLRNFHPLGGGPPLSIIDTIFLLLSIVLILAPLILFPISAYLNRQTITALNAPNLVFGIWGAFPIILLVLLILPFAIFSSYQSYFYNSYKQQLQTQPIELSIPNLEVVVNEKGEKVLNIYTKIENIPDTLSEFYLLAKFGTENPVFDGGYSIATINVKKDADGWTFSDTEQHRQITLPSPNIVTFSIPVRRYELLTPTDRQSIKIFLGTRHMNLNVPIKSFWFPIQIPE